jgi:exopolyphosphatase / guanosine-5'-triphosphate,3'-diphosphate pyrophosphatase
VRLGVVDLGSNTVHLAIVDASRGEPPLATYSEKYRLRLAEKTGDDRTIPPAALERLVECVGEASATCHKQGVDEVLCFATAVVRDAGNRDEVVQRITRDAQVELQEISGEEEARFIFGSARRWFGWSVGSMLVLDIGGGSLEIATGQDEQPSFVASYPLGAGRLTRELLPADRPSGDQIAALRRYVRDEIRDGVDRLRWEDGRPFCVATSKTFRQLARLAGAAPTRRGPLVPRRLKLKDLERWVPKLAGMSPSRRSRLPGVSRHRAHQVLAGALVAETTMKLLGIKKVAICPWALREGIILSRLDAAEQEVPAKDQTHVVLSAVQSLKRAS